MQGEQENFKMNPRTDATNTSACTATRVCNNSTAASRTPCNVTIIYWSVPEENNFKLRSFWEKMKKKKKLNSVIPHFDGRCGPPLNSSIQQIVHSSWSDQIGLKARKKEAEVKAQNMRDVVLACI